jgi:hypothetical protein
MPVAQSPAHYINSSKGCPSITESFPLFVFLVLCATVAALPVVQPHLIDSLTNCDLRGDLEVHGEADLAALVPRCAAVLAGVVHGLKYNNRNQNNVNVNSYKRQLS